MTKTSKSCAISQPRRALHLDVDYYQSILDDADIPDADKQGMIEALWNIITTFVDLGFNIHPAQQSAAFIATQGSQTPNTTESPRP